MHAFLTALFLVNGYWLNIPGQGPRCPTCNPANRDIAIQTLLAIG